MCVNKKNNTTFISLCLKLSLDQMISYIFLKNSSFFPYCWFDILYFCFAALYSLEEDWTDIVENSASLDEKTRSQQTALWELVETEVAYIRTLKVIQDVSSYCQFQLTIKGVSLPAIITYKNTFENNLLKISIGCEFEEPIRDFWKVILGGVFGGYFRRKRYPLKLKAF